MWVSFIINLRYTSGRMCWESSSCENTWTNLEKCLKSSILIWLSLTPNNCISLGLICSLNTPRLKNPGTSPLGMRSEIQSRYNYKFWVLILLKWFVITVILPFFGLRMKGMTSLLAVWSNIVSLDSKRPPSCFATVSSS